MFALRGKKFEYLFLTILFCFSIALFNLSGMIFSVIILILFLMFGNQIHISNIEILLFLFSFSYGLFYYLNYGIDVSEVILYFIGPWSAYVLGKMYIENSVFEKSLFIFIAVLSFGMYLHGVLNIVAYVRSDYFSLYKYYRHSVDFWRNELVNVKSTEMLYTFATGFSLGILFSKYRVKYKLIALVVVGFSLFITAFLANRTLLVIFAIVFAWRFLCWLVSSRVYFANKMIAVLGSLFLLVTALYLVESNVAGIGDYFYSLKVVKRFLDAGESTRFDIWVLFFKDLRFVDYPFGGKQLTQGTEFSYLHNAWLDIYNVAGVIPFVLAIVILWKFVCLFIHFCRTMKKAGRQDETIVFQCIAISVFLNMMVEPIIEANPYYFMMVMMLFGAMEKYTEKVAQEGCCYIE